MADTATPRLEELPKVDAATKSELTSGVQLRHVEPEVKNPLPTADDVKAEKTLQKRLSEIEAFDKDKLTHTEVDEKHSLPSPTDLAREKVIDLATHFDKSALNKVQTKETHEPQVVDDTAKA